MGCSTGLPGSVHPWDQLTTIAKVRVKKLHQWRAFARYLCRFFKAKLRACLELTLSKPKPELRPAQNSSSPFPITRLAHKGPGGRTRKTSRSNEPVPEIEMFGWKPHQFLGFQDAAAAQIWFRVRRDRQLPVPAGSRFGFLWRFGLQPVLMPVFDLNFVGNTPCLPRAGSLDRQRPLVRCASIQDRLGQQVQIRHLDLGSGRMPRYSGQMKKPLRPELGGVLGEELSSG